MTWYLKLKTSSKIHINAFLEDFLTMDLLIFNNGFILLMGRGGSIILKDIVPPSLDDSQTAPVTIFCLGWGGGYQGANNKDLSHAVCNTSRPTLFCK